MATGSSWLTRQIIEVGGNFSHEFHEWHEFFRNVRSVST